MDLLTRSGFADEGDAVLDLLRQFDSGDGESEELLPQHGPEQGLQHLNRKVKISVMRIPARSTGQRAAPASSLLAEGGQTKAGLNTRQEIDCGLASQFGGGLS